MSELVSISNAVKVRDQERQMETTGGFDLDFLAPDYLGDVPSNPTDGPAPFLLDLNGNSSGLAAIAGLKVSRNRSVSIRNEISRLEIGRATCWVRGCRYV